MLQNVSASWCNSQSVLSLVTWEQDLAPSTSAMHVKLKDQGPPCWDVGSIKEWLKGTRPAKSRILLALSLGVHRGRKAHVPALDTSHAEFYEMAMGSYNVVLIAGI